MPELKIKNSLVDDRYEILERQGQGSYAEIFLARDRQQSNQLVIVKALNTSLHGTLESELEQTLIENFLNEEAALKTVSHPNIIRLLGEGTAIDLNGKPFRYITLEYMPGGDLLKKCKEKRLSLEDIVNYMDQICNALSHAHSHDLIHRDIKPNNLLLSEDEETVKIADFGVAKITSEATGEVTRVGSDIYAPPEHHPSSSIKESNRPTELTPSADIYSLAKTIYTLITGRAPQQFEHRPITELPREKMSEPWAQGLLSVLNRATSTEIEKRYKDAESFLHDLKEILIDGEEITRVRASSSKIGGLNRGLLDPADLNEAKIVVPLPPKQQSENFTSVHSKKILAGIAIFVILCLSYWGYSTFRPATPNTQNTEGVSVAPVPALSEEPAAAPKPKESAKSIKEPEKPKEPEKNAFENEEKEPVKDLHTEPPSDLTVLPKLPAKEKTKERPKDLPQVTPEAPVEGEPADTNKQLMKDLVKDKEKEKTPPKEIPKPKPKELPKVVPKEVPESVEKEDDHR